MNLASFFGDVVSWLSDSAHWQGTFGVPNRVVEHVIMSGVSVGIGMAVALPIGLFIGHTGRFGFIAVSVANLGRAIPSFGLLFLFVLWLGLGLSSPPSLRPPIIFALVLLAIPPMLTNTYVAIQDVDRDTIEAARGMGYTGVGILTGIELPLAAPLILAGIRTAAVQVVATATLGAVVAGGGLGRFIIDGFATRDFPQIFAGALFVAGLAIATEVAFAGVERLVSPTTASSRREVRAQPQPWERAGQAPRPPETIT